MGTRSPIDLVCIGFILGPLENKMPPNCVAMTYLNASEVELGHSDLIRNISL